MYDITASIVTYKNSKDDLKNVISSFLNTRLKVKLYISDNSPNDNIEYIIKEINDKRIEYIHNSKNSGFGYGHNIIIKKIEGLSKYHLILNPDIYFESGVLEKLYNYMEENSTIGNIMPMVRYPDYSIQYLCKRKPRVRDLFLRRFCPIKSIVEKNNYYYEMRDTNYDKIIEVPSLSGCFMFTRTEFLLKVGGFDERFFMYMEDIDICIRLSKISKLIFYPEVEIYHKHGKESYKSLKMTWAHIKSVFKYFNKHGWVL